jgi:deoxyribonuclease IV
MDWKKGIKFGAAGNPMNFFKSELRRDRFGVLEWSKQIGLNAQERQMTYGARMKPEDAVKFGKLAIKNKINLSVHGPYYVVLTSEREGVFGRSVKELIKTCGLAEKMGATKVVFHPGYGRDVRQVIKGLKLVEKDKPKSVVVCPETMGKISQLGSLNEVIEICEKTESRPCIDFAHLHARTLGKMKTSDQFRAALIEIEKRLGKRVLKNLHCHFYPIQYTDKGEKVHRAITEKNVFPRFKDFAPLIREFKMTPCLISESKNSQDLGALEMKKIMEKVLKKKLV